MADGNSTPLPGPALPGKLPYFQLCEASGKYKARRSLTTEQIIRAARVALTNRFVRGIPLSSPALAVDYLAVHFGDKPAEVFVCLFLDNRHRLIAMESLFHGTINGASVHPREIMRRCMEHNASAVILAHYVPRNKMGLMRPVSLCAIGRRQKHGCWHRGPRQGT
jgi:DNA repair protein RadC